jgi:nitrile hydratase subunit beta
MSRVMFAPVAALSDMGGRTEFYGPILREEHEPVFHSRAEGRVFGMSGLALALMGRNVDAFRHAMEQLPREVYLSGYYSRWLAALERMLVRAGYLGPDEVEARIDGRPATPGRRQPPRMQVALVARVTRWLQRPTFPSWVSAHVLPRMFGTSRPALSGSRFSVGDRIRVRPFQAEGHTRQPGYVTGKPGVVTAHHGATLFPDAHAVGRRARPVHLYTVAFDGRDLWGERAEEGTEVRIDLYEPYLVPA